ncbi:hypothetical protein HB976_13410 [Yersinia mollaretii]|uniref:hypothetical protein n=1 Tax=Yersinia mollaretii TaxID=33060 RepID=UPI001427A177|nr:hypothetical protein [Yersinia mollaretii]MDA5535819.1 hypothetical protein [Yersinia mollaretii]NIL03949.1 hypothetical protein [Yersinia mollaretii]
MIAPKPKSAELIELLTPSLIEGENFLSEFEARRVIACAKQLPDRYQGICIEGLVKIICGDIEEGSSLCERSLLLAPHESVTWTNYALALANKGLHSKQIEILKRAIEVIRNPVLISDILVIATFWVDVDLLNKVAPMFAAMEIKPNDSCEAALRNLDKIFNLGERAKDVEDVAKAVMKVAEKHNLPAISSQLGDDGYGMIAFSFTVDTDDINFISTLNDELYEEMIEHGLETSNCIGYFEPKGE